MNNYKISSLTFSFITICLISSNLLGTIFPFLLKNSKNSFLFSLILSFFIGLLFLLLFIKVFNTLPDKNIVEKINYTLPKFLSKTINTLLMILVFFIVIISFFKFSTFISSEYLTDTPTFMITLLLSSPIYYASHKDIDVAGRCATLILLAIMIMFFISRLSLTTMIDIENLKPIFIESTSKLIITSVVISLLHISPMFLTLIIPKNNIINKEKVTKYILITYLLSFLMIILIILTIVGILGLELSTLYTYPSYVVLKNLNILNFIKNIENFSVIFWIMFMSFTCAFGLVYIKTSIVINYNIIKQKTINRIMSIVFVLFLIIIYLVLPYENYLKNQGFIYIYIPLFINIAFLLLSSFLFIFKKSN